MRRRVHKTELPKVFEIAPYLETEVRRENDMAAYDGLHRAQPDYDRARSAAELLTRLEAARAIRRTDDARHRLALLVAHSTLAGETLPRIKSAARLMADSKLGPITRRGKRWKICPVYGELDRYQKQALAAALPPEPIPQT